MRLASKYQLLREFGWRHDAWDCMSFDGCPSLAYYVALDSGFEAVMQVYPPDRMFAGLVSRALMKLVGAIPAVEIAHI
jgi:hypothetical protein